MLRNCLLPGVIIFSGMGNDGAASLRIFEAAGGRVWAQAPTSAVCPAMPQAALDTGLVQRSGDPAELALALEALYTPLRTGPNRPKNPKSSLLS